MKVHLYLDNFFTFCRKLASKNPVIMDYNEVTCPECIGQYRKQLEEKRASLEFQESNIQLQIDQLKKKGKELKEPSDA